MQSQRFTLNSTDIKKWLKNTAIFFAPAALIFLLNIQSGMPVRDAIVSLQVWALSTAIDIVRKYIDGTPATK